MVKIDTYEVVISDKSQIHDQRKFAAISPYDALDQMVEYVMQEKKKGTSRREISRGYNGLVIEISAPEEFEVTPGLLERLKN